MITIDKWIPAVAHSATQSLGCRHKRRLPSAQNLRPFQQKYSIKQHLESNRKASHKPKAISASNDGDRYDRTPKDSISSTESHTVYVRKTLRAGQVEEHPGTVVVYGDVNAGSAVIAGGDIIVWGRLRGDARAGMNGEKGASILALEMQPTQLQIADVVAYGPTSPAASVPEKAVVEIDGTSRPRIRLTEAFSWERKTGAKASPKDRSQTPSPMFRSALITGTYIALVGLALLLFPTTVFGLLFDLRFISTGWVRVFGVLSMTFGIYYLGSAYGDSVGANMRPFYVATVIGRMFLFTAFCVLVATKKFAEPALLVLGLINFASASSMLYTLRQSQP
ncbi:hypothetical protein CYMTET_43936 [Cymbomonas tetramitiformis]|uniref:Septum formation inhibitor MinC C-terminal domain-containing protein n=1 Tax=Cymbomonas tetramitiformis TaxID=36881 RepID=A0AAE0C2V7_9CHLO|nr:hypothetical protein CYMTET_43936 [Cymbomonas tetramitiformis]